MAHNATYIGAKLPPLPLVAPLCGCHNPEKALVVYQNAKGTGEVAVQELLARARIVVPALMNYLFFSSTHVAVLYLGKSIVNGKRMGVREGAVDMKIRMLRYLTTEMWPPLLRTDAPEESCVGDLMCSGCYSELPFEELLASDGNEDDNTSRQRASLNLLKQVSLRSEMEVLVYLKNGADDTKYLKLILRNTMHRLHFDVIDPKDEKHRWEARKLFTRILDNLETRKAIPSYEAYERAFREACSMAARLPVHQTLLEQRVEVTVRSSDDSNDNDGDEVRFYPWMASLTKPEGSMLDYKSYIFDTVDQIKLNCVRFMCGFLNAYSKGRLLIGVHEVPKRNPDGSIPPVGDGKNNIVRHDDLVDQYVVGVRITDGDLLEIQEDLSKQLLACVPPVPPQTVRAELLPVRLPDDFTMSGRVLVLCDGEPGGFCTGMKQKIFSAMHQLVPQGLSLVPVESKTLRQRLQGESYPFDEPRIEFYCVAAVRDPAALEQQNWEGPLLNALEGQKVYCHYFFVDDPGDVIIPPLSVIDISVDLKRSSYIPLRMYPEKFFSGWPSIPIWDTTTNSIRRVERNYNIFRYFLTTGGSYAPVTQQSDFSMSTLPVPWQMNERCVAPVKRVLRQIRPSWFNVPQISSLVLSYLGDILDCLRFRLLNSVCDMVFELRQGTYLLQLLLATPLGNVDFSCSWDLLSRVQNEMLAAEIPPMPLLLCRTFESIGILPSPFPYVAVPLIQQSFRVSPYLVPLFYLQRYFDGQMKPLIVLDLRDGVVKSIHLRNGEFTLEAVVGVGFGRISKRRISQFGSRNRSSTEDSLSEDGGVSPSAAMHGFLTPPTHRPAEVYGDSERSHLPFLALPSSERKKVPRVPREVEEHLPLIEFRFLTEEVVAEFDIYPRNGRSDTHETSLQEMRDSNQLTPWTLSHLLSWFNVLSSDEHVLPFGYCKRSVSYCVASLQDVCLEHVEHIEENNLHLAHIRFADSPQSCLLHKKTKEWMSM
ncbi:hypothetical protein DQ04_06581020 [Trypanosoma grayi]|uniref:hypothetical protein n=1 Tax=Trypanosoma grayi TaxID=71804 RepID=UPI0004F40B2B|nr:hypothetical protein DQ04_06581020 [Trypanosoma grayi]KEG08717.1 hypothetical protein DQ04_06581020 [Trypanosoma grayi]